MIKRNQLLARFTTFKIGGPADWFCEAKNEKEILEAVKFAQEKNLPYFILGNGSNVLVADEGVRGMVIKVKSEKLKVKSCNSKFKIMAEAGVSLNKLIDAALKNSLIGLEFMAGIPGTLGGAVVGNAGAWQENIGDKVERVKILTKDGRIKWLSQRGCQFAYRQSRFKKENKENKEDKEIILEVELNLKKVPTSMNRFIEVKMEEYLKKREDQPQEPSAGSIFTNPKPKSAGDLIEKCGLKGKRIGQAQISERHANFIINLGGAKAKDLLKLITLAREVVKKKFKVNLDLEVNLVGEFHD